ncbi:MAG: alkyl hydroperoxide reductase [Chloroflexi bacterium]|nr:alkyl hydroperoxide reductase [Chloroflexota bacterium]
MLPQLRKLERRYAEELAVVSVHSPKFPTERETPALRQAVLRLRIEHPVLNDRDFAYWRRFGARAWPTLYFVDPRGNVIGRHEGELTAEAVEPLLDDWIAQYRREGALDGGALPLERATAVEGAPAAALSFPGKVHYDAAGDRLFVADSNHDRIIAARLDGTVEQVVGGFAAGFADGAPETARFDQPQGMAVAEDADGRALFVADLENHAIRRIDLGTWQTTTVAGTGEQARTYPQPRAAAGAPLNSPWDLAAGDGGVLYIAMAGFHQLWTLDSRAGTIGPWAGSMREGIEDGPRASAELAQPSGLSVGPGGVAFADSESNAVRLAHPGEGGRVETLIGSGLFDFGDADGAQGVARLQHPLDVAWLPAADGEAELYVADTFNHKIKQVYPRTQQVRTVCGGLGDADGGLAAARFNEPGGLCAGPGRTLIVADTNNHRVRVVDLAAGLVRSVELRLGEG